jgi:hypothetical protein
MPLRRIVAPRPRQIACIDSPGCPPRCCRPPAARCWAPASATGCAPAPRSACAGRGGRTSARLRSRRRSPRARTRRPSPWPRGARARTGSASRIPIATASRWPRWAARRRSTTATRAASNGSPRAGGRSSRTPRATRAARSRRRLRLRARRRDGAALGRLRARLAPDPRVTMRQRHHRNLNTTPAVAPCGRPGCARRDACCRVVGAGQGVGDPRTRAAARPDVWSALRRQVHGASCASLCCPGGF